MQAKSIVSAIVILGSVVILLIEPHLPAHVVSQICEGL